LEDNNKRYISPKQILIYPVTVMSIALIVIVYLVMKVVPTFEEVFSNFGLKLPWPTQLIIQTIKFLKTSMGNLVVLLTFGFFGFLAYQKILNGSDSKKTKFLSRIEHFLIFTLALIIGFIVWAMFLPMFYLGNVGNSH
jgi:type II secretory pathway component PulF